MKKIAYLILLLFIISACKKEKTDKIEEVTARLKGQWNAFSLIRANGDTVKYCPYCVVFNYEHGIDFRNQNVYYGRYADTPLNPDNATFETRTEITGSWQVTDEHTISFSSLDGNSTKTFTILKLETNYLEVRDIFFSNTIYRMRKN